MLLGQEMADIGQDVSGALFPNLRRPRLKKHPCHWSGSGPIYNRKSGGRRLVVSKSALHILYLSANSGIFLAGC